MADEAEGSVAPRARVPRRVRLAVGAVVVALGLVAALVSAVAVAGPASRLSISFAVESLNGAGDNLAHPTWGRSGSPYARVAPARYADGVARPVDGPNARAVSNRIFNDTDLNVISERGVSQWAWVWGQFLDHTFALRQEAGDGSTSMNIPLVANDPMERFHSTLGVIPAARSAAAPGTGTGRANPRQQIDTLPSYIDASPVYGTSPARLDWLRAGPVDGDPTNNSPLLLLPGGYLPTRSARGNPTNAPPMEADGRLLANPSQGVVAGDLRTNENLALTATQTLFAREHNRIVSLLPRSLSDEDRFQIARRVVIAEEQYITYQEFLPAMGVALPAYRGYQPWVDTQLSNEFATVGFRAHSQVHGDGFDIEADASRYGPAQLAAFTRAGLTVTQTGKEVRIAVPLGVALFNPQLLQSLQLGPVLQSIGAESQYNNDIEIDNQLRSTMFAVPTSADASCLNGPTMPACFSIINDLAALDVVRGRDHGIPSYNQVRAAYGLAPKLSFTAVTGERTDRFPAGVTVNDPRSLDVLSLTDIDGNPLEVDNPPEDAAVHDVRRATVAARLRAVYGSVDRLDAFVGINAEPHVPGTEMGETELAMWTREFTRLRDGDRFFYGNDQGLSYIKRAFGIDFRHSLAQIIEANSELKPGDLNPTGDVFLVADDKLPPASCTVGYTIMPTGPTSFRASIAITNNGRQPINGWGLVFQLDNGQVIRRSSGALVHQSRADVTMFAPGRISPGATVRSISFTATDDGAANAPPPTFRLNGHRCAHFSP
jgi:hypothetical protein